MDIICRSKAYFGNLLDNVLYWLSSHRSHGVRPSKEEYLVWEGKLSLACMLIRDFLEEDEKKRD